jgi:L-threonylcarbamoyladenylate synthase
VSAAGDSAALRDCVRSGGVAVFPADTVYGLCCDPEREAAVRRLYELKGRPPAKPAALMCFSLDVALGLLPELGPRTRAAVEALCPGAVTLLLPNPERRFPLTGGELLGLRVIDVGLRLELAVLQSSANDAGAGEARRLDQVPEAIRAGADLVIDGGELPGVASTVIDLSNYELDGRWGVLRAGAVGPAALGKALRGR